MKAWLDDQQQQQQQTQTQNQIMSSSSSSPWIRVCHETDIPAIISFVYQATWHDLFACASTTATTTTTSSSKSSSTTMINRRSLWIVLADWNHSESHFWQLYNVLSIMGDDMNPFESQGMILMGVPDDDDETTISTSTLNVGSIEEEEPPPPPAFATIIPFFPTVSKRLTTISSSASTLSCPWPAFCICPLQTEVGMHDLGLDQELHQEEDDHHHHHDHRHKQDGTSMSSSTTKSTKTSSSTSTFSTLTPLQRLTQQQGQHQPSSKTNQDDWKLRHYEMEQRIQRLRKEGAWNDP